MPHKRVDRATTQIGLFQQPAFAHGTAGRRLVGSCSVSDQIEARIKELLGARLQIAPEVLAASDADTSLLGRGIGLDSMEALTLANALESEFGLAIDDDDLTLELFATIGSVAAYVRRSLTAAS